MKFFLLILLALVYGSAAFCQAATQSNDALILRRAEKALTDVIVHDIFSPPVASRIYAYANIAAYEVLAKSGDRCRSLVGVIKSMPEIQPPNQKVSYPLAAVYAFLLTGKKLVFSEKALQDSITTILKLFPKRKLTAAVYDASLEYGKKISDSIMSWVSKDNYTETRKLRRYQFKKEDGKWIPTPPGYMAAIEPYWNKIRTLVIDSASHFKPVGTEQFSKEKSSLFYQQAYEVYEIGKNLTVEQREIANFWDCNPFFLNTGGHLNFATKKISPGGHWMSIAGILCRQQDLDIVKTSAVYTSLSIAMFDGFISCWDEKYRSNLIRPETYINAYIDESWRPLLQTPPFPEYPSGHSVVSTACAVVLTRFFGENVSFTDNSEVEFGLPERRFPSIAAASNEAAISRLYGGIHYRPAIVNGQTEGEQIGKLVVTKVVDQILAN